MPYADEDEQREYQRVWAAERRKKRQKLVRELLGDKCSKCGSNDRLHAHHVNRSDKEFSLLRGRGVSCSKGKWIREAEKCILLCIYCHAQHHADETRIAYLCTVDGCEKKHLARGFCCTHYNRIYRKSKDSS